MFATYTPQKRLPEKAYFFFPGIHPVSLLIKPVFAGCWLAAGTLGEDFCGAVRVAG